MSQLIQPVAEYAAVILEARGLGDPGRSALRAAGGGLGRGPVAGGGEGAHRNLRQRPGRGILLGLELLVVADIIRTVAVELTFETVGVLAIIVVIRTFLSFTLELELTGQWPWQGRGHSAV